MKAKKKYLFAALIVIALLLFFSCGASGKVPNGAIERFVQDSRYYDSGTDCSWKATHSVDKESHTDLVNVVLSIPYEYGTEEYSCTALFIYDRSSDLWSLSECSDWELTSRNFNNKMKMKKTWEIEGSNYTCTIDVTDVSGEEVTLNYTYAERVSSYYYGTQTCTVSGSGTFSLHTKYNIIILTLPDGFYASNGLFGRTDYLKLEIDFSPEYGIRAYSYSYLEYDPG